MLLLAQQLHYRILLSLRVATFIAQLLTNLLLALTMLLNYAQFIYFTQPSNQADTHTDFVKSQATRELSAALTQVQFLTSRYLKFHFNCLFYFTIC